jgi:membrane protease YdiL (CAAX protease family)
MRVIAWLLIYLAAVFVGGALAAPWLYALTQWGAFHWPGLAGLAAKPFHRFVDRAVLGLAVICLWPLLRQFRMLGLRELGLCDHRAGVARRAAKQLALGFFIGFVSLAAVALLAILGGNRAINVDHSQPQTLHYLLSATAAAILVAFLEELLFRGALYGIMRGPLGRLWALILSSAIYAAVHFVQKAETPGPVHWQSGLLLLPPMFRNLADTASLIPAFMTLTVAGAVLALMYERTGALYASIGLHGGWIFWLKSYRFTTRQAAVKLQTFWGTDNLVDGWLALIILSAVLLAALAVTPRVKPQA